MTHFRIALLLVLALVTIQPAFGEDDVASFARIRATRIERDFKPSARLTRRAWRKAVPIRIERETATTRVRPEVSTTARALWSDNFLYLAYECPFRSLTVFNPRLKSERFQNHGLWEKDVVEAFVDSDPESPGTYTEYEWAPNGEALDLKIERPNSNFPWSSGMEWAVRVDRRRKIWRIDVRIPMAALSRTKPQPGTRWRINLYRIDKDHDVFLAMNPTLNRSFHTPERFGWLEFGE